MTELKIIDYLTEYPDSTYQQLSEGIGIDIRNIKRTISKWESSTVQIIKKYENGKYYLSVGINEN